MASPSLRLEQGWTVPVTKMVRANLTVTLTAVRLRATTSDTRGPWLAKRTCMSAIMMPPGTTQ
eukprot:3132480-Rhodomonas_salina.2